MQQAWEVTTKGTNTMTNAHDPTFPNIGDHAGPMPGLTAIEHAALVTGQPCSGTPWLDEMLAKARRERLAGQALAGLMANPNYPTTKEARLRASSAIYHADALIAALEGGGK
jgi:hypothetical protein